MNLVLDTNAYSAYIRGDEEIVAVLRRATTIFVPAIVYGELLFGFYKGARPDQNVSLLKRFMAQPRVRLLPINEKVAEQYAQLRIAQEAVGRIVAPNDLWIAAVCVQLDLPLLTVDRDFGQIEQLELVMSV